MRVNNKSKQYRPVVVVSGPDKKLPFGWWACKYLLNKYQVRALYVTPNSPELPESIDGLVVSGGDDIEPRHYGFTGDAKGSYNPARDELEINIISQALLRGIPILGICRGAQLLNVVLGGKLYSDIRELRQRTPNRNTLFPVKWVDFEDASLLHTISCGNRKTDNARVRVNQLHHQAIKSLGKNLRAIGKDADGFIQAVHGESASGGELIGVQWHPEYMPYLRYHSGVFRHFANTVKRKNTHSC